MTGLRNKVSALLAMLVVMPHPTAALRENENATQFRAPSAPTVNHGLSRCLG